MKIIIIFLFVPSIISSLGLNFDNYKKANGEEEQLDFETIPNFEFADLDESLIKDHDVETAQVAKRMGVTVSFMGILVSYPQYLRLSKLQQKVIKLKKVIESLHEQYTQAQLDALPQYKELMGLHMDLMPLLPEELREKLSRDNSTYYAEFRGQKIPYNQYLKMKSIMGKIDNLNKMMGSISKNYSEEELEKIPRWIELKSIRKSLEKQLNALSPNQTQKRSSSTFTFNGMNVNQSQLARLMKVQEQIEKFDNVLRKITMGRDPKLLANNEKWKRLVEIRKSLQDFLPGGYPSFDF